MFMSQLGGPCSKITINIKQLKSHIKHPPKLDLINRRNEMNKILLSVMVAAALAACSSTPKKEAAAPVTETKVAEAAPSPATAPKMPEAQPLSMPLEEPSPFPTKGKGGALGERSIYYAFDSYAVNDAGKPVAAAHAGFLASHNKAKLTLQGNCDERGSREYNLALGSRRAESVKSLMTVSGAAAEQIEVVSFGKEKPMAAGHDEAAWSKNRRVDIVYQGE